MERSIFFHADSTVACTVCILPNFVPCRVEAAFSKTFEQGRKLKPKEAIVLTLMYVADKQKGEIGRDIEEIRNAKKRATVGEIMIYRILPKRFLR